MAHAAYATSHLIGRYCWTAPILSVQIASQSGSIGSSPALCVEPSLLAPTLFQSCTEMAAPVRFRKSGEHKN